MKDLTQMTCAAPGSDATPLPEGEIETLHVQVPGWSLVQQQGVRRLQRTFSFDNFAQALAFTNTVGQIAEEQNHHPLIELTWGRVTVSWWTHQVAGLHQNDFIMAAKTDAAATAD